eukprot:GGOE01041285.1.p1 GENE.GGOE01041285.1~~GGOE01041285.1.p1  ORF type:complete len:467 (-),score=125.72 GGOE01041285.1:260-1564(-)
MTPGHRFAELHGVLEHVRLHQVHALRSVQDIPGISEAHVSAIMAAALQLSATALEALPEGERWAAQELQRSPHYAIIRERVAESLGLDPRANPKPAIPVHSTAPSSPGNERIVYDSRTNRVLRQKGSRFRDPVWEDAGADMLRPLGAPLEEQLLAIAAEVGVDRQVVAMCQQALVMSAEELHALPEDAKEKVMDVRESPVYAPLRYATRRISQLEAEAEQRLLRRAQEVRVDPQVIRSCAMALRLKEGQLAAVETDHERGVLQDIRTGDKFAPVRHICYDLGLAPPPTRPMAVSRSQDGEKSAGTAPSRSPAKPTPASNDVLPDPAPGPPSHAPPQQVWPVQPVWQMEWKQGDGSDPAQLKVRIELPQLESAAGVELMATKQHLSLSAAPLYRLELDLPVSIDIDAVHAQWRRKPRVLCVTLTSVGIRGQEGPG